MRAVLKRIVLVLIIVGLLPQFLCAQPTDIRTVYKEVARKKEVSDALKYETAQAIQLKKGDLARRLKVLREEKQSLQKVLKKNRVILKITPGISDARGRPRERS